MKKKLRILWKVLLRRIFPIYSNYGDMNPKGFTTTYQGIKMSNEEFNEHFKDTFMNAKKLHNLDSSDYIYQKYPTTKNLN